MKLHSTLVASSILLFLTACEQSSQSNNGYSEPEEVTKWSYDCAEGKSKMTWEFKQGEKGRYVFSSGSIMIPVSETSADRLFKRQDGTTFEITGDANSWKVKNSTSGTTTTCKRTNNTYYIS